MAIRHLLRVASVSRVHNNGCEQNIIKGPSVNRIKDIALKLTAQRTLTHYPIDNALYGLTSEQIQLRETVFNFFQKELAPIADKIDKDDDFPGMRDFWKKLGGLGLLGITADTRYGGSGMGILEHCLVLEELARVSSAVSLSYGAHSNLCVNQINRKVFRYNSTPI